MIESFNVLQSQEFKTLSITAEGSLHGFPFLTIDVDSYINRLTVQTEIDYDVPGNRHCIAIGKFCSLSYGLTFLIDRNHDYGAVVQGNPSFLKRSGKKDIRRKGTIILQNDVWIGNGATILSGVTLHNGSVIAANAVVARDVPPYAIVAGNPAKIIRYRFDEPTIAGMQKIAWWDWEKEKQILRAKDFELPPQKFVKKYLPEAEAGGESSFSLPEASLRKVILFIPDVRDPFPLYPKIFHQFFETDRPNVELLIYLSGEDSEDRYLHVIDKMLLEYEFCDSYVTVQSGITLDESVLFQAADYYVTTRARETVRRTCLADRYGVSILYGTDDPIFTEI